jgi:O-acetylhomoserine (thiol)-lyase
MVDLEAIAAVAGEARIPLIVDNTLATPALLRPFEWGADIAVYSTTKFIAGHGNSIGGVIVDSGRFRWDDRTPALTAPNAAYHGANFAEKFGPLAYTVYGHAVGLRDFGAAMAPMTAFLTLTGAETLCLRMARHSENAFLIARHLEDHAAVAWVSYAGLTSHPNHALARKYLPGGAGAVLTFGLKGGYDAGIRMVEACRLFSHLANVGDTRSLIIHPASTTHRQLSEAERAAAGAGPDVVRLSVGIEDAHDLIADLNAALAAAAG